jgi:hypothetical protein
VLSSVKPVIDATLGTITFNFGDTDTTQLMASSNALAYSWQFLRIASGKTNSDLLTAGPLTVGESPPFPIHV